jgi:hypothetical protein
MSGQSAVEFGFDFGGDLESVSTLVDNALPESFDEGQPVLGAESKDCFFRGFHDRQCNSDRSHGRPETARGLGGRDVKAPARG